MGRQNWLSEYTVMPEVPMGGRLPPCFDIIIPTGYDETNMVLNPSLEVNSTNWTNTDPGSLSSGRTVAEQYIGAYSYALSAVFVSHPTSGVVYGNITPLSTTSGVAYVYSAYFFCPTAGLPFTMNVTDTSNVAVSTRSFYSTGFWQRIWLIHRETSTTSRRLNVRNAQPTGKAGAIFYIDGMQFVATPSGQLPVLTTYIDGDQLGFVPDEFPAPYYWLGTPHLSTSVRGGLTRSGGKIVSLQSMGLILGVLTGLGMSIPQHSSIAFSQLNGETYQRTVKGARTFTLGGRITNRSLDDLDKAFGLLTSQLDIDATPMQQPLLLQYTPRDELEMQIGVQVDIPSTYMGGLEGMHNNLNTEVFTATFKQYFPTLFGHSEGAALDPNNSVSNANALIRKSPNGTWAAMSTGLSGGAVTRAFVITPHPNGTIYVGGDFTDAGGSGADYAAIYNPLTDTFSVIKAATTFNNPVRAIVVGPDGRVYFGGDFTNADGIANADGIVVYDPVANTFAALGTGVSAATVVRCLAFDRAGNLYAGGTFATMGGVANTLRIARWDGSVWNAMGTGANNPVDALIARGTNIFAGGTFTAMGGVADTTGIAMWDGAVWTPLAQGMSSVADMAVGRDNLLYIIGGSPTSDPSIIGITSWNGVKFGVVGSNAPVTNLGGLTAISVAPNGSLIVSGTFDELDGINYADSIATFDGASYNPMDADLPGVAGTMNIGTHAFDAAGNLYVGFNATGTATVAGTITVTHSGNDRTYPKVTLFGPLTGTSRIYQIAIPTTNRTVRMEYTIQAGEVATFIFDPLRLSFTSTFQGDLSPLILPGSDEADFFLTRGTNIVTMLASGSPTGSIEWKQAYTTVAAPVGKT